MKETLKSIVNWPLQRMGLKIVRAKLENISYQRLFDDLALIIEGDSPLILDVGANVGQTIDALQSVFNRAQIHAFEPSSKIFKALVDNNYPDNIKLYQTAFGAADAKREFINYKWSTMSSFLELDQADENRFKDVEVENTEIVDVSTIDDFIAAHSFAEIDLLKIDTQGFDLEVLKGASNTLANGIVKHVMVELNFIRMYKDQSSWMDIVNLLNSHDLFLIDYYEKVREAHTIAWTTALFGRR